VGGYGASREHNLLNRTTGAIIDSFVPYAGGGYGCIVDGQNVLWGANGGGRPLIRKAPGQSMSTIDVNVYGLVQDRRTYQLWQLKL
jgi:hypothetical protein